MTQFLPLRSGTSGAPFVGDADDDTLLWSVAHNAWSVGPAAGGVTSVFGRTGVVVAATGDYDSDQIDNLSTVPGASVSDALDYLATHAGTVASVFGRTGVVVAVAGDYTSTQVTNSSTVAGATVTAALNTLGAAIAAGVASVFGRTGAVVAVAGDYAASQITNDSGVTGSGVAAALNTLNAAIDLTGARVVNGPANTFLAGGTPNSWQTLFTAPTTPTQDGFVTIASAGNFTYLSPGTAGNMLNSNGSAWVAGVDFAALSPVTTAGFLANSATGFVRLGLVAGSGAGVASAASGGNIRGARGANGFLIEIRNDGDTGDLTLLATDTTATPSVTLGSTAVGGLNPIIVSPAAGSVTIRAGSSATQIQLTTTSFAWGLAAVGWSSAVASPVLAQTTNVAASQTGQKTTYRAQNCTGATSTGGAADFGPGSGTTAAGKGRLITGGGALAVTQRLAWDDTGMALYGGATVAQAARVGQATNSTGVTPGGSDRTMADVTTAGLADPAKCNSNFAIIAVNLWNPMELANHNLGVTA
jgi:hypothetical protein